MNWDDLKSVWRHQEGPRLSNADLASIRHSFDAKHRRMVRALFWRDIREAVAGLVAAVVFALKAWHGGRAYWPIAISVVLILTVTGFFVAERIRAHRQRLGSEASILAKVESAIGELRRQRYLLLNVATWYIAPGFVAWAIVFVTSVANSPGHERHHPLFLVCYAVLVVPLMTWGVWALNRRVARTRIEPRLEELEKLHRELVS